jgi:excisionase family DNA binding protein
MKLYDKKGAAAVCLVSEETIDDARTKGRLGFVKLGRRVIFREDQLDKWVMSNSFDPLEGKTTSGNAVSSEPQKSVNL